MWNYLNWKKETLSSYMILVVIQCQCILGIIQLLRVLYTVMRRQSLANSEFIVWSNAKRQMKPWLFGEILIPELLTKFFLTKWEIDKNGYFANFFCIFSFWHFAGFSCQTKEKLSLSSFQPFCLEQIWSLWESAQPAAVHPNKLRKTLAFWGKAYPRIVNYFQDGWLFTVGRHWGLGPKQLSELPFSAWIVVPSWTLPLND